MSGIVKSTQQISITIAAGSTSNTATISAVNTSYSELAYGGVTGQLTGTVNASTCCASIVITNGTTITATRNTSDASNSITVNATVTEYSADAIQSIQTGSMTMTASTSQTATITSVTTSNSVAVYNGWTTDFTTNGANAYVPSLQLTSATVVTTTRGTGSNNLTTYFTITEYKSGILNSSTQQGTVAFASGDATKTATITSVTTGITQLVWGGFNPASLNNSSNFFPWLTLTNGTTITGTRTTTGVVTTTYFNVREFKTADIKSVNRGSIVIAGSTASNTATITAVVTSLCAAVFLGHTNGTAAQTNYAAGTAEVSLTNSTTVTATRGTSGNASTETMGWEATEFNPIMIYHDAWSDPDDVYPYRRKEERFLYPSVAGEPLLTPSNFNTVFAAAWGIRADVYPYRKPNNWWTRVVPVYQSNPANIGIFYAGAWEINNQVRYYPKPNFWWTHVKTVYEANPATIKIFYADAWEVNNFVRYYPRPNFWWALLPEKYEANPANIGIFYAGAWEVNNQVRYYPAKDYRKIQAQSVMQPELATIGLIFSAAFTVQILAPTRARLNLDFLAQNPVIDFTAALPALGEYIITLRRRRR